MAGIKSIPQAETVNVMVSRVFIIDLPWIVGTEVPEGPAF
jgi:hypothetical protein